jgi:uncharacterized protein involved in outer membrane biogenesis
MAKSSSHDKRPMFSRPVLLGAGLLIALALLGGLATLWFLGSYSKPRLAALASDVFGMQVELAGPAQIRIFPSPSVVATDVRLRNRGMEVAAAKEVKLGLALAALVRGQVTVTSLALRDLTISIEEDRDGHYNFERAGASDELRPAIDVPNISAADATLLYHDQRSGRHVRIGSCDVNVSRLHVAARSGRGLFKYLSASANAACKELRTADLVMPELKFSATGTDGVFDLKPISVRLWGGQGSADVRADYSGSVPAYVIHSRLAKFRIEDFFGAFSQRHFGVGSMDFAAELTMHGRTMDELKRTMQGTASLHGENLQLEMGDLDQEFSHYESTQNFNLVDVGAFFFAGPVGLAVTKGYNYATVFQGSRGSSTIQQLISEWKVEHGVAHAQDVAMTTKQNRLALQGSLNFVDDRFDDVTVALVDAQGCPRVRQAIRGPFDKPEVAKPNVIATLTGPTRNVL